MRPWEQLPIPLPAEYDPGVDEPDYFYNHTIKPLITDFIRIMDNPLTLDWEAVEKLRVVISEVLDTVTKTLEANPVIEKFQAEQYPKKFKAYEEEVLKSIRTVDYYLKEYDPKNAVHRTYIMNYILSVNNLEDMQKNKWSIKDCKHMLDYTGFHQIANVINKKIESDSPMAKQAMMQLALDKVKVWNKVRTDKVDAVTKSDLVPPFNPGSSKQKQELFESLGYEPLAFSKDTGLPSWGREQIQELFYIEEDADRKEILQMFIDHSFSAIIRNNFLESFDRFALGNELYGNLKLFGAKSFRPTGNSPNYLQLPSTGSIYAKPLKECLTAPEGYLVATIDYSALEDRVIANLSGDENKANIFLEGLDGHSLNAVGYFPEKLEPILGKNTDNVAYVKKFMAEVDGGNKELKKIRQEGKGPTFALAYGAYPPKIATSIKCSLEVATQIFDNYHNVLYPGITKYREGYVFPTAKTNGYVHLGLGCRIYSSNPSDDIRTLNNATAQFWSILTLLSINELHYHIDKAGMQDKVKVTTTIYDSIYFTVEDNPDTIKWLNETIVPIMEQDFLTDQIVKNEANLEIGKNWAHLHELPYECSIEKIKETIKEIHGV